MRASSDILPVRSDKHRHRKACPTLAFVWLRCPSSSHAYQKVVKSASTNPFISTNTKRLLSSYQTIWFGTASSGWIGMARGLPTWLRRVKARQAAALSVLLEAVNLMLTSLHPCPDR
jgi:hypothetical protein